MARAMLLLTFIALLLLVATIAHAQLGGGSSSISAKWRSAGPAKGVFGVCYDNAGAKSQNAADDMAVAGATNSVVQAADGSWLVGTVNGGVWRTTDDLAATDSPHWVQTSDVNMTCTAITKVYVSPSSKRVFATCGAATSSQQGFNSFVRFDAGWTGFGVSSDNGQTWQMAQFPLQGVSIEAVLELASGAVLVALSGQYSSVTGGGENNKNNRGIWYATSWSVASSGWKHVYSDSYIYDLRQVGSDDSPVLYASAGGAAAAAPILVSTDKGQSWTVQRNGITLEASDAQICYSTMTSDGSNLFVLFYLGPDVMSLGLCGGVGVVFYRDTSVGAGASWIRLGGMPVTANPNSTTSPAVFGDETKPWNWNSVFYSIDGDYSMKDRGAIFADGDLLYVVGNGWWQFYRVDWRKAITMPNQMCTLNNGATNPPCMEPEQRLANGVAVWQPLSNTPNYTADTAQVLLPHVDTRALAMGKNSTGGKFLIMTSDGGIFIRFQPMAAGGWWRGRNGDLQTLELSYSLFDPVSRIAVGAAQDNGVALWNVDDAQAPAFLGSVWTGDGQYAQFYRSGDTVNFFASIQFYYQLTKVSFASNSAPLLSVPLIDAASTPIALSKRGFPERASSNMQDSTNSFPFMQMAFAVNSATPNMLCVWSNRSAGDGPGIYCLDSNSPTSPATLVLPTNGLTILDFVVGGTTYGMNNSDVVIAVSPTTLFVKLDNTPSGTRTVDLSRMAQFTAPTFPRSNTANGNAWCNSLQGIDWRACSSSSLIWPNHANTMSLAVHGLDSSVIAVTGWPKDSLLDNVGTDQEHILFTRDGGARLICVFTSSLYSALGITGSVTASSEAPPVFTNVRPNGMLLVRFGFRDILFVGTARGVVATTMPSSSWWSANFASSKGSKTSFSGNDVHWVRIGGQSDEFPIVKISNLQYAAATDELYVGTMGRGSYILKNVTQIVANIPYWSNSVSPPTPPPSGSTNVGAIVGGVIGGVVFLALCATAFSWYRRRGVNRNAFEANQHDTYREVVGTDASAGV